MAYKTNIEKETLENENYRKVLYTGDHVQLVVMNLEVGEDIPEEVHGDIDQFIRVENGSAKVIVDGESFDLGDDDVIIIPAGKKHYVKNTSETEKLKLYSIYGPAEHKDGTVHETYKEALEAGHEH